jgi:hypothetical protein
MLAQRAVERGAYVYIASMYVPPRRWHKPARSPKTGRHKLALPQHN